jgi:hypothetical protein
MNSTTGWKREDSPGRQHGNHVRPSSSLSWAFALYGRPAGTVSRELPNEQRF